MIVFLALLFAYSLAEVIDHTDQLHPLSNEFIDHINSKQSSWRAGRNFPANTSMEHIKKLMGTFLNDTRDIDVLVHGPEIIANLPESFDPRDKWTNCPSLNEIRDQGSCGSCWAFGAVSAMTDRVCIFSNQTQYFHFSAEDLLACCNDCGSGCNGGYPSEAWEFWTEQGIVSGGNYNSGEGCLPYEIEPCEHHVHGNRKPCKGDMPTPECKQTCLKSYNVEYGKDKRRGEKSYTVDGEEQIKAELFQYGPLEVGFDVYSDFLDYKSGVYTHTKGDKLGSHAVKLMGWGVEKEVRYWLLANSWNNDWGDKGYFKILRGSNHCGIESSPVGGWPVL